MKDRENEISSSGQKSDRDAGLEFASRRTVVKGLASTVPVILTLSHASQAHASLDCAQREGIDVGNLDSAGAFDSSSNVAGKGSLFSDQEDPYSLDGINSSYSNVSGKGSLGSNQGDTSVQEDPYSLDGINSSYITPAGKGSVSFVDINGEPTLSATQSALSHSCAVSLGLI